MCTGSLDPISFPHVQETYKMIETCDPNIASWYVLFCQYGLQAIREHEISQITHDD